MFERLFLVIRLETENIKVGKVERFCIFAEKICDITISSWTISIILRGSMIYCHTKYEN